ncbi:UNVERIFIED_CONTAM: protein phosphatase 2C domain-containing protein [Hammondia hammondi]|eukprot:XP_008884256.1 protein phosphatase 2C domain-containing protein [Hammondia hammondi]
MPTFSSTFPARLAIPRLLAVLLLLGLWHGRAPESPTVSATSPERHGGDASTGLAEEASVALTGPMSRDDIPARALDGVALTQPLGHSSELEFDKDNAANGRLPSGFAEEGETTFEGEVKSDVDSSGAASFEPQGTSSESLVSNSGAMVRRLSSFYTVDDLNDLSDFKGNGASNGSIRKSRSKRRKSATKEDSAADASEPSKRKTRSREKQGGAASKKKPPHAKSRKSPSSGDKSAKTKSKSSKPKKRDGDTKDRAAKAKGKKSPQSTRTKPPMTKDGPTASKSKSTKAKKSDGDTKDSATKAKGKTSPQSTRRKPPTTKAGPTASKSKSIKDKKRDGDTKDSAAKEKGKTSPQSTRRKPPTIKAGSIASQSKSTKAKKSDGDTKDSAAKAKGKTSPQSTRRKPPTTKDGPTASKSKSTKAKKSDGDTKDSAAKAKGKKSLQSKSEESSTSEERPASSTATSSTQKEHDGDKQDRGPEEDDMKSLQSKSEESSTSEDRYIASTSRSFESGEKRKSRRERNFWKKKKSKKSRRSRRRNSEEALDSHRFSESHIISPAVSLQNGPRPEVSALDARDAIRLTFLQLIESPETRLEDVEALVRHAGPVIEQDDELVNAVLAKVVAETSAATARLHGASEIREAPGEQPKDQEQEREDELSTQQDAGAQGQETSDATAQVDNTQKAASEKADKEDSKLEGMVNMQEPETETNPVMEPHAKSDGDRDDDSDESSISAKDPRQKLIVHYSGGHVTSYAASMVGRRPTDEDAVLVNFQLPNMPGNCLTALFDGHGGSEVSFFAAHNAPQFFEKLTNLEPQTIENAIKSLDAAVVKLPELRHAGTTGVFVFIERLHAPKKVLAVGRETHPLSDQVEEKDEEEIRFQPLESLICEDEARLASRLNLPAKACPAPPKSTVITIGEDKKLFQLTVANVGDSRAMLIHEDGTYTRLSRDHTPSAAGEQSRIENAGGFVEHSDTFRVNGVLSVSRAFGDRDMKANPYLFADGQIITAIPEIRTFYAKPSDLLLLACDGLFEGENMTPSFVARYINERRRTIKHDDDIEHLVSSLLDEAYIRGSEDNISVILTRVREGYSTRASQGFSIVNGAGMILQSGRGGYALTTEGNSAAENLED